MYIYILYHISVVHGGYEATCNCTETTLGWKSPSFCPPSNHGFCGLRSSHRHCILGIMISVAWNFKPETNCGWLHSWIVRVKSWIIYLQEGMVMKLLIGLCNAWYTGIPGTVYPLIGESHSWWDDHTPTMFWPWSKHQNISEPSENCARFPRNEVAGGIQPQWNCRPGFNPCSRWFRLK